MSKHKVGEFYIAYNPDVNEYREESLEFLFEIICVLGAGDSVGLRYGTPVNDHDLVVFGDDGASAGLTEKDSFIITRRARQTDLDRWGAVSGRRAA